MRNILLVAFLVTGCSTSEYNKPYPKIKPKCPSEYVQFCEGRHPKDMVCQCVKRSVLERELRNLRF